MSEMITEDGAAPATAATGGGGGGGGGGGAADVTSASYYFDSYSHFGIHEEMLKDEVRTRSYMNAIEQNKHLFRGKIVLDVGCGTGILSMFAARAGAAKVYAVECSQIVEQCRQIVIDNGFQDTIEVIQAKMEDVVLPCEHVDIILSEWMGYFLLYESMLETVLWARDRYLRPPDAEGKNGGIILPDKAILHICAIEDSEFRRDKIDFWDNVYGFSMRCIKEIAITEPLVDVVEPHAIISKSAPILSLDLATCTKEDLSFSSPFSLKATRNDYCHALVAYFDCAFTSLHKPIVFSTAPSAKYTHWKQTVFYLSEPLTICDGEEINGVISCAPNARNPRDLDIKVQTNFVGSKMQTQIDQSFRLR